MTKKLFRIKIEYETFKIGDDEIEVLDRFWSDIADQNNVDCFINDCTEIDEIEEAEDLKDDEVWKWEIN